MIVCVCDDDEYVCGFFDNGVCDDDESVWIF